MTFYIDAWLDRPEPYVQVKNKNNQKVVAKFAGDELARALEHGDICVSDFCDASAENQLDLVKSLLLLRCCEDIGNELQMIYSKILVLKKNRQTDVCVNTNVVLLPIINNERTAFA